MVPRMKRNWVWITACVCMLLVGVGLSRTPVRAAAAYRADKRAKLAKRGDIRSLPDPLKQRLVDLGERPRSTDPIQAFAEADQPSMLFGYFLLDTTHFQPNVWANS